MNGQLRRDGHARLQGDQHRTNRLCVWGLAVWATPIGLVSLSRGQALPYYRVTEVGHFGFDGPNEVEAINNAGHVVGWSIVERRINGTILQFITRGYVWMGDASTQLRSVTDGEFSWASDINDVGMIVGRAQRNSGEFVGCLLSASGPAQPLVLEGAAAVSANGINRDGLIVGGARVADDRLVPFFLDYTNGATWIVAIDGAGAGIAVNDLGTMVGRYADTNGSAHLFRAGRNTPPEDLSSLLPPNSAWVLEQVWDINNRGVIVGTGLHQGVRRSFRGVFDGSEPEVLPPLSGDTESYVNAINDDGLAVGHSFYYARPAARWTGVVWTTDQAVNINDRIMDAPPGLWVEGVRNVNARGSLVVRGVRQAIRQYVLTPLCAGDLDFDGDVDVSDLALLLSCFALPGCPHDLDSNGVVDLQDLAVLLAGFGASCP